MEADQLTKRIIGFNIQVTHFEAAWKLHQDYSIETQKGVVTFLEHREDDNSKKIAEMMRDANGLEL
ncbi:hypothetical protein BC351_04435 [Paenibacillus ferrarius]|uniref:Uncharacterized protein n=1 Tax=Paenibacillus ferrarius TaxID=1469647 RepID=A0A1V4HL17_9BACL|nr:hypothetical protein [Paenibacillus ferrarius]OPH57763.1 hypothetical protein BC351_04435 [Paenibacillus ferrarius]